MKIETTATSKNVDLKKQPILVKKCQRKNKKTIEIKGIIGKMNMSRKDKDVHLKYPNS